MSPVMNTDAHNAKAKAEGCAFTPQIYVNMFTQIPDVNLFAFVYWLFHEHFFPLVMFKSAMLNEWGVKCFESRSLKGQYYKFSHCA